MLSAYSTGHCEGSKALCRRHQQQPVESPRRAWRRAWHAGLGSRRRALCASARCSAAAEKEVSAWRRACAAGTQRLLAAFLAAAVSAGIALPSHAVTNEQLLFLEAWRAVDRAYVDKTFNGQSWFRLRERYLKAEPMGTRAETYAAIRSALASLGDPFTRHLEPPRYAALKRGAAGGSVTVEHGRYLVSMRESGPSSSLDDPITRHLEPPHYTTLKRGAAGGSVTGVGLEVGFDTESGQEGRLVVITPSEGGPAQRAGVQPRTHIVSVGGRSTAGLSLYEAGDLLQGAEGSQVTLMLEPPGGSSSTRELTLTREKIVSRPVTSQLCAQPKGLGYLRVATFSSQTPEAFKTALAKLQKEGADRYVLDIRNNGGGSFPAGIEVARMLIDSGDIVLIADAQGVRDTVGATGQALEASAPLTALVNRGTASASEVLAGALQDSGRGRVAGERTFGKGLIQTVVDLSDGSGLAITVSRYQTPLGTDINKVGIQPDLVLDPEQAPPLKAADFCSFAARPDSPQFFK